MKYIFFIILMCFGLFMRFKPYDVWRLENYFVVKDGEPTEYAIEGIKYRGIISIIFSFIVLVFI